MGKKTTLKESLRKFGESLPFRLHAMYLFGSRATGKAKWHSDVDLVVVSQEFRGRRPLKRAPLLYPLWSLDYPVDFVCLTPEEFRRRKREIGVVQEAVRKGIKIL